MSHRLAHLVTVIKRLRPLLAILACLIPPCCVRADDFPDLCLSAQPASNPALVTGVFDSATDADWFIIPTIPGHLYRIASTGTSRWTYYDSDCVTRIGPTTFFSYAFSGSTVATSNSLRFRVGPGGTGQVWTLAITDGGPVVDDFANEGNRGLRVNLNDPPTPGVVNYRYDEDWFRFAVEPGQIVDIEFFFDRPGMWLDWSAGISTTSLYGGTVPMQIPAVPPTSLVKSIAIPWDLSGDMWLMLTTRIYPADAPGLPVPAPYRIQVRSRGFLPDPDDAPNDCAAASPLTVNAPPTARALDQPLDVDVFTAAVMPQQRYRLTIAPLTESAAAECKVLDSGCLVTLARDVASESEFPTEIDFTGPASGQVYFRISDVSTFRIHPWVGLYSLSLAALPNLGDDHGNTPATATRLGQPGLFLSGATSSPDDEDWFMFTAPENAILRMDFAPITRGVYFEYQIFRPGGAVRDAQGSIAWSLGLTPPPPSSVRRLSPFGQTGDWYVLIKSFDPGSYQITAYVEHDLATSPHATECSSARTAPVGGVPFRGWVNGATDQDWITFPVFAGHRYRLVHSEPAGGNSIPSIFFPDCQSRVVREDGVNLSAIPEFVPSQDGQARVRYSVNSTRQAISWLVVPTDLGPIRSDPPPLESMAFDIPVGGRVFSSMIDFFGDVDALRIRLRPGLPYTIAAQSEVQRFFSSSSVTCEVRTPGAAAATATLRPSAGQNGGLSGWETATITPPQGSTGDYILRVYDSNTALAPADFQTRYALRIFRPLCRGDWDGSGEQTVADILAYINDYFASPAAADFDGLRGTTISDLLAFLDAWFDGCS